MLKIRYKHVVIKGQKGFGDSVYLYPIVKWHVNSNFEVTVASNHAEVFEFLDCNKVPYGDYKINAGYLHRKNINTTNQFQDMCYSAGIPLDTPYDIDIVRREVGINTTGKLLCLVTCPYLPLGGMKNSILDAKDLMPDYNTIQGIINNHREYYYVLIGKNTTCTFFYENIDLDLSNADYPNINWLFNLVYESNMILSQTGHMPAIAEGLDKKIFLAYSAKGLNSTNPFLNTITPKKILTKLTSGYVIDSWPWKEVEEKFQQIQNLPDNLYPSRPSLPLL